MINDFAPIVLFVYNRPEHTKRTIDALKNNLYASESHLFIYSDGPKDEQSALLVAKVRKAIKSVNGFKNVTIIERDKNYGLAKSVINGVSDIVNKFGKVIVLEDDLICAPEFLKYMNEALINYENCENVFSVTGFSFGDFKNNEMYSSFSLKLTCSWSWGTWKDKWDKFDMELNGWEQLDKNKKMKYKFNFDNSYNYYDLIIKQINNKINSWAIRWYWSVFKCDGLTVYPTKSLIINNGFDGSGTHCGLSDNYLDIENNFGEFNFCPIIQEDLILRAKVASIIKKNRLKRYKTVFTKKGIGFVLIRFYRRTKKVFAK